MRTLLFLLALSLGNSPIALGQDPSQATGKDGGPSAQFSTGFVIYGGLGEGDLETDTKNGDMPWAIGGLAYAPTGTFYGFDIGGEGTSIDSTYRNTEVPVQANSFNAILGRSLGGASADGGVSLDVGILLGFRETAADCPDSFVGFRCYADRDPDYDHTLNRGAILLVRFDEAVIGLRSTSASQQIVFGLSF